jgi:methionyl-tRNA formyltransferase
MTATADTRAVVFAYHEVGVRGLRALAACGVDVKLVVTHRDNPAERIWFGSVAATAAEMGLPCITPDDANDDDTVARVRALAPRFVFSLYYRQMLKAPLLDSAREAYNLHGSLLPRYRGRVPVNWAVIRGERETGATLHAMVAKPDAGAIVDQQAVPILPDDTAAEVFAKVVVAGEMVLVRAVPRLIDGSATLTPQDLSQGNYCGGRKPEDGRIPSAASAAQIHNLVRGVAAPYPGAFFDSAAGRVTVWRTARSDRRAPPAVSFSLVAEDGQLWLAAADGAMLRILSAELDGRPLAAPVQPVQPNLPAGPAPHTQAPGEPASPS